MSDEPKRTEPCKECGSKSSRHFYIGDAYNFTLCTKCRSGTGYDYEIGIGYMKKASVHFRRLWNATLKKEGIKLKKEQNIPNLHSKDDFFRPVARYENYFDLQSIKNEIASVWEEKIDELCYGGQYPILAKYDPISTFVECVTYALSGRRLKSKYINDYVQNSENKWWNKENEWLHRRFYWKDFDFHTYTGKTLFEKKWNCYVSHRKSFEQLQALFRGYIVRKKANDRLRGKSAVKIQASWRKKRAMLSLKKHKQCAVKIQALYRGYYVRRPYGIYRSWALWNVHTAPQPLRDIVHTLVRHGAVQRPKKRRKKVDPKQKTLHQFWTGINISS